MKQNLPAAGEVFGQVALVLPQLLVHVCPLTGLLHALLRAAVREGAHVRGRRVLLRGQRLFCSLEGRVLTKEASGAGRQRSRAWRSPRSRRVP